MLFLPLFPVSHALSVLFSDTCLLIGVVMAPSTTTRHRCILGADGHGVSVRSDDGFGQHLLFLRAVSLLIIMAVLVLLVAAELRVRLVRVLLLQIAVALHLVVIATVGQKQRL